ncbi:hypothetical protein GCM10018952_14370 [Streptosporangium vulgare]
MRPYSEVRPRASTGSGSDRAGPAHPDRGRADLTIPAGHRLPIAVVGAGAIVDVAHLPAYRAAGLEVTGLYDLDGNGPVRWPPGTASRRCTAPWGSCSPDERIAVVDIAVRTRGAARHRAGVLESGRHVLCQKPSLPTSPPEGNSSTWPPRAG